MAYITACTTVQAVSSNNLSEVKTASLNQSEPAATDTNVSDVFRDDVSDWLKSIRTKH